MNKKELIKIIRFHLKVYHDGIIDGDDLANAIEENIDNSDESLLSTGSPFFHHKNNEKL